MWASGPPLDMLMNQTSVTRDSYTATLIGKFKVGSAISAEEVGYGSALTILIPRYYHASCNCQPAVGFSEA